HGDRDRSQDLRRRVVAAHHGALQPAGLAYRPGSRTRTSTASGGDQEPVWPDLDLAQLHRIPSATRSTEGRPRVIELSHREAISRVDQKREAEALDHVRKRQRDVALKILMVVYGDLIAGFIARLVSDPERVKHIYQEVFLRVFRGIHKFRSAEHGSMWLW